MSHIFPVSIWDIVPSSDVLIEDTERVLFVGQKLSGTATPGVLVDYIGNSGEEDDLFGEDSHLAEMIRLARLINKQTIFSAIPLADPAVGDQATGSVTITGAATSNGKITLYLYSGKYHKYEISVISGKTNVQIATLMITEILKDTKLQIIAADSGPPDGIINLTAKHKGIIGNGYGVWVDFDVTGISIALDTTPLSGGTGEPIYTDIFKDIGRVQYRSIVWPSAYPISGLPEDNAIAWADSRWNGQTKPLDGQVTISSTGGPISLVTFLNTLNDQNLNVSCELYKDTIHFKGPVAFEFDDNRSALFAAIRSLRLTDTATLGNFGYAATDSIGGPKLASLPYHNTPVPQILPKNPNWDFTDDELKDINDAGGWAYVNNVANTSIILSDIYTTYKTNAQGFSDPSFKFDNYVLTMSEIRQHIHYAMQQHYKNTRLSGGIPIANETIATQSSIKGYFLSLCTILSASPYLLIQAGPEVRDFLKRYSNVELNLAEGIATITAKVPIVTQLRKIIGILEVSFNI